MAQVLVRQLDDHVVERLKQRAREHGRSLQSAAKTILEEAVHDYEGAWKRIERFRKRLQQSGRTFSDSAAFIREDRPNGADLAPNALHQTLLLKNPRQPLKVRTP